VLALVLSLVLALAGPVSASSPSWNVSGTWGISFVGTNGEFGTYTYSVTLVQTGTSITGSGTLTSTLGSPVLDDIAGSVSGNTINFSGDYGTYWAGNFSAEGTIASGGTMSGTWTQSPTGGAVVYSGTWTTTSGHATPVFAPIYSSGSVTINGVITAPTINFTAPGSAINLGQLYVNTTTPWGYTGTAGTVSFLPGSDTNGALALSVTSTPYGQMQNQNDSSYLPNNLSVALGTELSSIASNVDTDGTTAWVYGDLPAGPAAFAVPTTGVSYSFDVAARQVMGAAIPSAGPYQITMNVVAGYTP